MNFSRLLEKMYLPVSLTKRFLVLAMAVRLGLIGVNLMPKLKNSLSVKLALDSVL